MQPQPIEGSKGRLQEEPLPARPAVNALGRAARQGANLNMVAPAFADSGMVKGSRFDMVAPRP